MTHGTFVWNELMTTDVEKAKAFYTKTVGWDIEAMSMPNGTYWIAKSGGKPVAGLMAMAPGVPAGTPPNWLPYLEVDDVDGRCKAVTTNGGKVMRAPFDIPGVGRIAIVTDATGAAMGLMKSAPH